MAADAPEPESPRDYLRTLRTLEMRLRRLTEAAEQAGAAAGDVEAELTTAKGLSERVPPPGLDRRGLAELRRAVAESEVHLRELRRTVERLNQAAAAAKRSVEQLKQETDAVRRQPEEPEPLSPPSKAKPEKLSGAAGNPGGGDTVAAIERKLGEVTAALTALAAKSDALAKRLGAERARVTRERARLDRELTAARLQIQRTRAEGRVAGHRDREAATARFDADKRVAAEAAAERIRQLEQEFAARKRKVEEEQDTVLRRAESVLREDLAEIHRRGQRVEAEFREQEEALARRDARERGALDDALVAMQEEARELAARSGALRKQAQRLEQERIRYAIQEVVVTGDREPVFRLDSWRDLKQSFPNPHCSAADVEAMRRRLQSELESAGYGDVLVEVNTPSLALGFLKFRVHAR